MLKKIWHSGTGEIMFGFTFRRCGPRCEFVWLSQSLSDRWITGRGNYQEKNNLKKIK